MARIKHYKAAPYMNRTVKAKQKRIEEMQQKFIDERDRAILSLDRDKINLWMRKYNLNLYTKEFLATEPTQEQKDRVFWSNVHWAVLNISKATNEQRDASIQWLQSNGFEVEITNNAEEDTVK